MSVTLHTDLGDLKLELYCSQMPRTCENFLALCASSYYDGVLIHRVIKDFMVQMGDPTGKGKGGESIWGGKFEDEIPRLPSGQVEFKHDRKGVLSMANSGPGTNGSQFFITCSAQPHLDGQYTVFGRLIGGFETLDALEALEVNPKKYRPLKEVRLQSVTVHANPIADDAD